MYSDSVVYKAVIPVGGLGTRLLPATKVLPKELLPVGRRPIVQYVVEEMRAAGLEHICFVTGRKKAMIQEHFDHDPELVRHLQDGGRDELLAELAYLESGLHLTYIRQSGPQGLADALGLAEEYVDGQPFVVALGDSIICEPEIGFLLRRMIDEHVQGGAAATIAVEPVPPEKVRSAGIVCPAEGTPPDAKVFAIADILDRPRAPGLPCEWGVAARFVFSPEIFAAIRHARPGRTGELQLTDSIRVMLQRGARVQGVRLSTQQRRHDIGNFGGYFRAFLDFALMDPYFGDDVRRYLQEVAARQPDGDSDATEL